jgi:ceramide glucosyltransferase
MNASLIDLAAWICLGLIAATVIHAAVVAAVLNLRGVEDPARRVTIEDATPPITWFRPIKTGVLGLRDKLEAFLAAIRGDDQVILGIDVDSPERAMCESIAAGTGDRIEIVDCIPGTAANPKISKLAQMTRAARHENWVVVDSEVIMDRSFAESFRNEWAVSGANVLTAGYRIAGADTIPQRLDSMSVLLTLWPGLELVRMFGTIRFTLGACTAVRRGDLMELGGWAAFGNNLAEDHELGLRLTDGGRRVRISHPVLTLDSDPMSWSQYWRHQVRVAATYRAATPAGAAGLIFTRGVTAGFLLLFLHPGVESFIFLLLAWGVRVALAMRMARRLQILVPGLAWTVPFADVVETAAWIVGWFASRVWWGGRWRSISWRGRLAGG